MNDTSQQYMLEQYAKRLGGEFAKKIDNNIILYTRRPNWCPYFIYKLVVKYFINIAFVSGQYEKTKIQ